MPPKSRNQPPQPGSPAQAPDTTKESSQPEPRNAFLQKLKDYKELIAILVFFIGGVAWIYGYFATKSQLAQLNCLLSASIDIATAQPDIKYMPDKIVSKRAELASLKDKAQLSEAEKKRVAELENDAKNFEADYDAAKKLLEESGRKARQCTS